MIISSKKIIIYLIFIGTQMLTAQDYHWTGNGDGIDFFQEANWMDTASGLNPEDGTINPSQSINFNLFLTCEASTSSSSEVTDITLQTPELFSQHGPMFSLLQQVITLQIKHLKRL